MSTALRFVAVLLLAAVLLPAVLSACPLCADAKSNTDYPGGAASLPKGFYYSILFMVMAPFAVTGSFVFRIYATRRRALLLRQAETSSSDPTATPLIPDPGGARP